MPGLQGWAETRKTDREGRRPPIGEGRVEFREAVERTGTGSPIDESAPMMDVGCSSLSRKANRSRGGWLCAFRGLSVPAEGPGSELVSAACNAAREDGPERVPVVTRWRRDAGVQIGMQAQARESFGRAASGAPSQCVAVALFCGLAASMAASPGLGCQARRLVPDELHFLERAPSAICFLGADDGVPI